MAEEKTNKSKIAERTSVANALAVKEEEILKFWQENKIFSKTLDLSKGRKEFVFYEGPPTANGKPGIHHLEARAYKDVIPRYKTMQGFYVRRKGGWDTHGLPVELQVEKELGLKSKKEIEEYGVAEFNKKCKESVWRYVDLWEKFTDRIGYWVDQKDPYITYKNDYIESVWNIIKKAEEKKLLYKDYKIVPWCPRCGTGLSSHELAQGYKDVKDTSVTVKFKIKGQDTYILAWTTTPWTLPGNVALAVGENIDYVKIKVIGVTGDKPNENLDLTGKILCLAKDRLKILEPTVFKYDVLEEIKGKDLIGLEYEPLFPYAEKLALESEKDKLKNAFKVYAADFVTTEDGTGVVHTAVMYGQEDFDLGNKIGLPKIHTVNDDGTFKEGMGFLSGRFVKEKDEKGKPTLDIDIFNYLKEQNYFFSTESYLHSYPFCWRCDTSLIYYARDSWYIKMSELRDKLIKENKDINWVPSHIKDGRFGEWLREVKDWAISRERYWGTPLPVWQNEKQENFVVGNIENLKKYTKKSGNKYFVMRHGEAEQNIGDFINSDPKNVFHLTENGKQQVKIAAQDIKSKKIDLIISSPFQRCKDTAEIVRQSLNLPLDCVLVDNALWEEKVDPKYEGKTWSEFRTNFSNITERYEKRVANSENFFDTKKRVGNFLYSLEVKYKNKNILLVSHQLTINALFSVAMGTGLKEIIELKEQGKFLFKAAEFDELLFDPLPHNDNYELDLHKPFIDQVELVDEKGNKLKRVKEVLDVWFDSGGMPFAQDGLEGQKDLRYPADFICEAIDQTRGWFYTLHAIGAIMDKGKAFKNCICLGHILDANGIKMSKHIGNVIDPWEMINKYGADALRMWMYTVNQPGDSKNFDEKTVDEVVKKVFNLTSNILSFFEMYRDAKILPSDKSENILDQWIIARLRTLIGEGTLMLENFHIFEAARLIRDFVSDFSTWYIRRSRDRFKSENAQDKNDALATTHFVLLEMSKYMAPFTPFFAESLYLNLKFNLPESEYPESVHLCNWPRVEKVDNDVIQKMRATRDIVSLALEKRMAAGIKIRQPLNLLKISKTRFGHLGEEYLELIKDEVNVKEISFDGNLENEALLNDAIGQVELDTNITPELQKEGNVREFIRAVQELRKNKSLKPQDVIELLIETDEVGKKFVSESEVEIKKPTNISNFIFESNDGDELKIENYKLKIKIK